LLRNYTHNNNLVKEKIAEQTRPEMHDWHGLADSSSNWALSLISPGQKKIEIYNI
jgi:hypothetical protein